MIKYNPKTHRRYSIRLKDYNYSQAGAYFITICTHNHECLFGHIIDGQINLNECGKIVENEWLRSQEIRLEIKLDKYQVMPNHFHAVVFILETNINVVANGRSPLQMKPKSLSSFMAGFKSSGTSKINILRNTPNAPVLQRNYYEHIIRNESELTCIREYINNNPLKWQLDIENPEALHKTTVKDYYNFTTKKT